MGKRDTFWSALPRDKSGDVDWPDDNDARLTLAADVVGARIVGAVESALETRLKVVAGEADDADEAEARGDVFSEMSGEQKAAVEGLLRSACFGSLYWMLVKLRECPGLEVDISLEPWQNDRPLKRLRLTEEAELHHWYFEWMEKFSEHRDEE